MIHPKLDKLHLSQAIRPDTFSIGDTVKVHYKIKEGNKERIQVYEGVVISKQNKGAGRTFTVRRISFDVGVERIFPLYTPSIDKIEVVRNSKVKRSKLYYLRDKIGKKGRLKEISRKPAEDNFFIQSEELKKQEPVKAAEENSVETTEEQTADAAAAETAAAPAEVQAEPSKEEAKKEPKAE